MPRPTKRQYNWDERSIDRLDKLAELLPGKTETSIIIDAIGHFLSTLERDERVLMVIPSEQSPAARKRHKRPDDAA